MPRYSEDFIEKVREANDIADVIGEYVALKSSGKSLIGYVHSIPKKHPLLVSIQKNKFSTVLVALWVEM